MRAKVLLASAGMLLGFAAPAHALIIAPPVSDSDYANLRNEMVARIPDYAPGWTDHAASDPGVTLLELFAFTVENLAYRVALDVPDGLLWAGYDSGEESTLGAVAYLMLDAAYLARHGNDVREQDWLVREGIDPAWTYMELRTAARHAVPEPGTLLLLALGLVLAAFERRAREDNRRKHQALDYRTHPLSASPEI